MIKRKCNSVGGFGTASHPSTVQLACAQVLLLARHGAEKERGSAMCGPPLDSISALGKWQFPLEHTPIKTPGGVVPGD